MVADQVDVFTRRWDAETGIHWSSDGQGGYTVKPVEGLSVGTQIGEFWSIVDIWESQIGMSYLVLLARYNEQIF